METLKKLNSIYSKTEKLQKDKKEKKKLKIVIIGGSHSGFSCAWILLNGPANPNINPKKVQLQTIQPEEDKVLETVEEKAAEEIVVEEKAAVEKPNSIIS